MSERKEVVKHLESLIQGHMQYLTPLAVGTIVDYANTTVIQHLCLYSYLITDEQELDQVNMTCSVYPPCEVPPLCEAATEAEWEVRERLDKVVAKYKIMREELESQKSEKKAINEEHIKELLGSFPDGVINDKESLLSVVAALSEGHAHLMKNDLMQHVKERELEINFKIEKTEALSPKKH